MVNGSLPIAEGVKVEDTLRESLHVEVKQFSKKDSHVYAYVNVYGHANANVKAYANASAHSHGHRAPH